MDEFLIESLESCDKRELENFIMQYNQIIEGESNRFKVKFRTEYFDLAEAEEIIDYIYNHNLI